MNKPLETSRAPNESELLSLVVPVFNERSMLPYSLSMYCRSLRASIFARRSWLWTMVARMAVPNLLGLSLKEIEHPSRQAKPQLWQRGSGNSRAGACQGDAVIVLDADLQDPPEYIPEMVRSWKSGFDVVLMQRRSRVGESFLKRWSAHLSIAC